MSALEALCNAVVGLAVSWAVTYWCLPIWGFDPSPRAALEVTGLYFVVSFARSWAIREAFRKWA